ncbi:mitochondrial carrier protein MTM1 isoform X2 [Vigna radiata var. radiata]|uniref:Mitochondrial carrier protein MTM1 isoform X2 n=1 Tax=Vigna radiata var. radiata TaxID=3916 RepID=A0A1S3TCD4_VIGRR|nr:mitochondrial carrier protein MTM1 isoform X2 [Vigna radiata var. radiata]
MLIRKITSPMSRPHIDTNSDTQLRIEERAFSAAGAAFLSAIIVNPLDVAKTRLQAQAAGVPYQGDCRMTHFHTNTRLQDVMCPVSGSQPSRPCPSGCYTYKGTLDVFYKVTRHEGFTRLWRGTSASLALAVPTVGIYMPCYDILRNMMEEFTTKNAPNLTPYVPLLAGSVARSFACISCYPVELARTRMQAFRITQSGKPPGVWKTLLGVVHPDKGTMHRYRFLWTGLGAQLSRDVPFSAICWSTLEPIRKNILGLVGDEASAAAVLGANFSAGFVAGTLASAITCPLDVAKTRRQIEKNHERALKMTTRTTLIEIWRDGGLRGLFTGVGPRVFRAGPSVGIVVSFYEVVKYALQHARPTSS